MRMRLLKRHRVGLVLLGLVVLIGTLVVYRLKDQQARAVTRARPDVLVGVLSPARRDLDVKLTFTADILAVQQAAIFSKVSGYIRRIHADRGDFVKAGQLLVEVDDLELQATVQQARAALLTGEAGLEVARSTLEGQRANLENQRANLAKARAVADNDARQAQRLKTLYERGLVSATDYENARTTAESSGASVRAAEAQLRVAEVQVTTQESQVRLPMALGIDVGSEANAPLARAVIGGLTISTALTLVLIPTLYVMLEERFPRRVAVPEGAPALQGDTA